MGKHSERLWGLFKSARRSVLDHVPLRNPAVRGWQLLKGTISEWWNDDVPMLAAAIAFYTVFSFAPALMIVIAVASGVYGREAARQEVIHFLHTLTGNAAPIFESVLSQARGRAGMVTTIGLAASIFGATAVFVAMQDALNKVWGVAVKPGQDIQMFIKKRILSFGLVLGAGVVLLTSLMASAILEATKLFVEEYLPMSASLLELAQLGASFLLIMFILAALFKTLPDVEIAWSDVWIGAAGTSFFFTAGKTFLGIYLGSSTLGSVYGAAGSFVLMLVWIYYSVQIFFLGSEFTQVLARMRGTPIVPSRHAVRVRKIYQQSASEDVHTPVHYEKEPGRQ